MRSSGIFFGSTSSHAVILRTGGTEQVRIDTAGRLLVGATSGTGKFIVQDSSLPKIQSNFNGTKHMEFGTGGSGCGFAMTTGHFMTFNHQPYADRGTDNNLTERLRINTDGGLLLGSSSSTFNYITNNNQAAKIHVSGAGGGSGNIEIYGATHATLPKTITFSTNSAERMRITSTGEANINAVSNGLFTATTQSFGTSSFIYRGAYGSTAGTAFSGTVSFGVYTNGNVVNANNSYGSLSDAKLKENIVDASSQWDDIKGLRVRNYNFIKGQTHTQIGVVAQEVEEVSPGLVNANEEGIKSVNYSVLYMKAVKALQEAMERIETLEAEVAALKNN